MTVYRLRVSPWLVFVVTTSAPLGAYVFFNPELLHQHGF